MLLFLAFYVLAICAIAVILRINSGAAHPFEPIFPAIIAFISLFSIRPIVMQVFGETDYYRWIYIGGALNSALAISALGVTAYLIGYFLPLRVRSRQGGGVWRFSKRRFVAVAVMYVVVGLGLLAIYLGSNPFRSLAILSHGRSGTIGEVVTVHTEYLFAAPILLSCSSILYVLFLGRRRFRAKNLVVILGLIAIPVMWFYLFGVRRFIIPSFFIPFIAIYLARDKVPKFRFMAVVLLSFFILAAIPFMRTSGARDQIGGFSDQIAYAFERDNILKKIFAGADTVMLPAFAAKVDALKEPGDFYYGLATVGDLVLAPIPSFLVDKPMSARNKALVDVFGQPCTAGAGGLCPDFSIVGTFYQDFWVPGVVFGMMIMGWVSRRIWNSYRSDKHNPYRVATVAVTSVFTFIIIRAGFMPAFQWSLYFWLPLVIGLRLMIYKNSAQRKYKSNYSVISDNVANVYR